MPFISKTVNKSTVKFEETFIYSINASFNGVVGEISPGQIIDILPDYLDFDLPPIAEPIKDIKTESVPNGTKIIFDFGLIEDTGISINIKLQARFRTGAVTNNTTYENVSDLFINGNLELSSSPVPVTLQVIPDWKMSKSIVAPVIEPSPGEPAYYLLELRNFGDKGLGLNAVINDIVPDGTILDSSFVPIGQDWSGLDSSADQIADIVGSNIIWNLNNYTGTYYAMIFKIIINDDVEVGDIITNTANWSIDGVQKEDVILETEIINGQFGSAIRKYGPRSSKPGELITYEIYGSNSGNQPLTNVVLTDNIPPEVFVTQVFPGNFGIKGTSQTPQLQYTLEYSVNNGLDYIKLSSYNYGGNAYWGYIDFRDITSDKITNLRWLFPLADIGFIPFNSPRINGFVDSATTSSETVNTMTLTATELTDVVSDSVTTELLGVAYIRGSKTNMPSGNLFPQSIIRYQANFNGINSRIDNPVVTDLLPAGTEYKGNLQYSYREYFENNKNYTSNNNPSFFPEPLVEVTDNYENTGRQFIRITFDPFKITQKSTFNVSFDVKVKAGTIGELTNTFVLGNKGETFANGGIQDINDLDNDGITNEILLETPSVKNNVLFQTSVASDKSVKGELDDAYTEEPQVGRTYEGGKIKYRLVITNRGNSVINSVEIVDILPFIGDTGVIETGTQRLSEFRVYQISEVTATIIPDNGNTTNIIIEYSESTDPVRFGSDGNQIGTVNDWTIKLPEDITTLSSFKLLTKDTVIDPAQSLIIDIECIAPVGTPSQLVAWNSFAANISYIDEQGETQFLLPVEPEKVGVRIEKPDDDKRKISGTVWFDKNRNGIREVDDYGVNGIDVFLFNSMMKPIKHIVTAKDAFGGNGYYSFANLDKGVYYVGFYPIEEYYYLTRQRLDVKNGSRPDPKTMVTQAIDLITYKEATDVSAGLVSGPVQRLLLVNKQASHTLSNVIRNTMLLNLKLENVIDNI